MSKYNFRRVNICKEDYDFILKWAKDNDFHNSRNRFTMPYSIRVLCKKFRGENDTRKQDKIN